MKVCYADIESTAIPASGTLNVERVHCLAVKSGDDETKIFFDEVLEDLKSDGTLDEGVDYINQHDIVWFHNGMKFDVPVIDYKLKQITAKPLDSYLIARLVYTKKELVALDKTIEDFPKDKYGSFSLDAFGRRMGYKKFEFHEWDTFTAEMAVYCKRDVDVTYQLVYNLQESEYYPTEAVIDLEHIAAYLMAQQEFFGFYFNEEKARALYHEMLREKTNLTLTLRKEFTPLLLPNGNVITPAASRRNKIFKPDPDYKPLSSVFYEPHQYVTRKNGNVFMRKLKHWFDTPHKMTYSYTSGQYQKLKLVPFDAGSRHKIRLWLDRYYGFQFNTFTAKGTPKVDPDELKALGEYGENLARYLKLVKDLSQLKGLLEAVRDDGTITSYMDTNGTVTGRFTSSNVNLNQIPAVKEFRELFDVPDEKEWNFIGTDFDGQENVNLAELLFPFDNGRLNNIIVSGDKNLGTDLHSLNAKATGLSRDDSKPLWFGFLYGSSSTLTGYTLLGNKDYTEYTKAEWRQACRKIERRLIKINDEWLYPVKGGDQPVYVRYTDQLVKQAIFGKHMQERLIQSTNGLSDLIDSLGSIVNEQGGVRTLGGRFIPVDAMHKALNYSCQGQGAEAMKYYIKFMHDKFNKEGLVNGVDYIHQATIYDEVDMIARSYAVPTVAKIMRENYADVSDYLGMKCTYTGAVMIGGVDIDKKTGKPKPNNWYGCH